MVDPSISNAVPGLFVNVLWGPAAVWFGRAACMSRPAPCKMPRCVITRRIGKWYATNSGPSSHNSFTAVRARYESAGTNRTIVLAKFETESAALEQDIDAAVDTSSDAVAIQKGCARVSSPPARDASHAATTGRQSRGLDGLEEITARRSFADRPHALGRIGSTHWCVRILDRWKTDLRVAVFAVPDQSTSLHCIVVDISRLACRRVKDGRRG